MQVDMRCNHLHLISHNSIHERKSEQPRNYLDKGVIMSLVPMYTIIAVNHIRNKKHRNDRDEKPQRKEVKKEEHSGEYYTKDGMFKFIRD